MKEKVYNRMAKLHTDMRAYMNEWHSEVGKECY